MTKALTILKILLMIAALICFGLCVFRESTRNKALLTLGLGLNAIAFLIHLYMTR